MRTSLATIAVAVIVAAFGSDAWAAPRYREVEALPIYRRTFTLAAGGHTISTADLQTGDPSWVCTEPDTMLVVTLPGGTQVANDNCTTSTKESCLTVASQGAWTYTITVFAAPLPAIPPPPVVPGFEFKQCGTMDLVIDGVVRSADVPFGGTIVKPGLAGTLDVNLVSPPAGALETMLIAYSSSWQELAFGVDNSTAQVGARATVTLATGSALVVGSTTATTIGRTAVILNDCRYSPDENAADPDWCFDQGQDGDNDRVSNALEAELGTDGAFHDTDRDGIFDYFEIFGRTNVGIVPFKFYGADPRRRDLFVEVDREQVDSTPLYPPAPPANSSVCPAPSPGSDLRNRLPLDLVGTYHDNATYMRDVFLDMPSLPPNPDGTRFVQVHVDGGGPCPGEPTLCGDWGGSQLLEKDNDYYTDYSRITPNIAHPRRGMFKYIYYQCGGNGQGELVGVSARADAVAPVTHELGHTFGMDHWGTIPAGYFSGNRRTYPSTMNYEYDYEFPQWEPPLNRGRWSQGQLPQMDTPIEFNFLSAAFAPHLSKAPFSFPVTVPHVDINRDGRISAFSILTDTAPLNRDLTGDWPDVRLATPLFAPPVGCSPGGCPPSGGPGIAVRPQTTDGRISKVYAYVPYMQGGMCYPQVASHVENADAPSQAWSGFSAGFSMMGLCGADASARLITSSPARVLLLFPSVAGVLHYRYIDPDTNLGTSWQPIPSWPAGVRARSASISEPIAAMAGRALVVWTDAATLNGDPNVWEAWFDPSAPPATAWTVPTLTNLASLATPGVTVGPDARIYLASASTAFNEIHLWHQTGPGAWSSSTPIALPAQRGAVVVEADVTRLSLVFQPLRTGNGGKFADGTGQLAVYWATWSNAFNTDTWHLRRATQDGYVGPSSFTLTGWSSRTQEYVARPAYRHSVAAAGRWFDASVVYTGSDFGTGDTTRPGYLPYASGTPLNYHGHVDTDDAAVISESMCLSVWRLVKGDDAACYCNTQSACTSEGAKLPAAQPDATDCPVLP